eukprot:TRINITY_DN3761_c0_g1_i1.p1 TRINITY_DN3761_c0_g1~~TRINITY_DN3761_c0_g1_i1.p1  ORF type:complete len:557 (+),score=89.68 TRINITY_DN3761_c0_g1_i1:35-1705(+)
MLFSRLRILNKSKQLFNRNFCTQTLRQFKQKLANSPSLAEFLKTSNDRVAEEKLTEEVAPYLITDPFPGEGQTIYIESYGCQMNTNDSEIVLAVMKNAGYQSSSEVEKADVILLNTCAIRDNAENKIRHRINELKNLKLYRKRIHNLDTKIGILGCMAERLKHKLLEEEKSVDLIAGPDAYRDLPRLLARVEDGERAVNVLLSLDETYADIAPVRMSKDSLSAYVSIMRGCNNMCSYCIVPFTRGRERSRNPSSIEDEIRSLSDQGYKEVVLLGQNVNSYNNTEEITETSNLAKMAKSFSTVYKAPTVGISFTKLMDRVSKINPEMRIRFTSPHPKDFPDELLWLIKERPNICKSIHMPAQSGSSTVLSRMRRGYTREAYLDLINRTREIIPSISISSDFITGFCGETEEEHEDTLKLLREVEYDYAYMFAYSLREKTHAHRTLQDDVPTEVKNRRLNEIVSAFYEISENKNRRNEIKKLHLALVEGKSKKSDKEWKARTDTNKKVVFPDVFVPDKANYSPNDPSHYSHKDSNIKVGDYVVVEIEEVSAVTLRGLI